MSEHYIQMVQQITNAFFIFITATTTMHTTYFENRDLIGK